tara:strand:- start:3752 stop:4834 length:1083 start_codon:yes stop_codon:yes gene_type:complete
MKICLLGNGITNILLANCLLKRNILVDLYDTNSKSTLSPTRTIALSKKNRDFINNSIIKINKMCWPIEEIRIYNERNYNKEILNFSNNKQKVFFMIKNLDFYKKIYYSIDKNKNFKKKIISANHVLKLQKKKYDLIINSQTDDLLSKKYFHSKIKGNSESYAYTSIICHKKESNNISRQIFTNNGPLAFLPLSNLETSVVYSLSYKKTNFSENEFVHHIKKYNKFYKIFKFRKIEKFKIDFSNPRKIYSNNIVLFGDSLHKIHPLTGQAFNITLRDIKVLLKLIDQKIDLGLPLDKSILQEFEDSIRSKNFLFTKGVEAINNFFKVDTKINNNITQKLLPLVNQNRKIKNLFAKLANEGF